MKQILPKNPKVYFFAILHFFITTLFDSFVFVNPKYFVDYKYLLLKSLSFVVLIFIWNSIFFLIKRIKMRDKEWIKKIRIFTQYFSCIAVLLLITWPGIWKGDEFWIYQSVRDLEINYWYHYLTFCYYAICLMIIPFGAGILLVQIIICSCIVSYIVYDQSLKNKRYYWLFFLFILPPVIFHNLYPMRVTLYAFFLLFLFYYLYFKVLKSSDLKLTSLIPVIVITPIISTWRSDGIIYLPFILLLLYIGRKNMIHNKSFIISSLGIIVTTILLSFPQNKWSGKNEDYSLTTMLNPLSNMLRYGHLNKMGELEKDLSSLINLKILRKYADYRETPAFHSHKEELFNSHAPENYKKFKKAYIKLVLSNPKEFLMVRYKTFLATSGFDFHPEWKWETGAFSLSQSANEGIANFAKSNLFNRSYNDDFRINTIRLIEGKNPVHFDKPLPHYFIFWNLFITLFILLILTLVSLVKRNKYMIIISLSIWASFFGVFFTVPAIYFMYYFPIYLVVYVLGFCYLLEIKKKEWKSWVEK